MPRYKEVNPGLFTLVTFPFQFGVMFGDMGHGFILLCFGSFLCLFSDKIKKQREGLLKMMLPLRYFITMMGFFAIYCGLIYNDFVSLNFDFFGSCYNPDVVCNKGCTSACQDETVGCYMQKSQYKHCGYKFGMDPIWGKSENSTTYINSLKMKLSVIIGVIHMVLGVIMKGCNAIQFKSKLDFYLEFLPQIIFISLTFLYMDFLIIYKWCQNYLVTPDGTKNAPSIISIMINMPLQFGKPGSPSSYDQSL